MVVRVENLNTDPPRTIGLINDHHPDLKRLWKSGVKTLTTEQMEGLLKDLENQGFAGKGREVSRIEPLDRRLWLRRLWVEVDGRFFEYSLQRSPRKEDVELFNTLNHVVVAAFNLVPGYRLDLKVGVQDLEMQSDLLDQSNRRKIVNPEDG